MTDPPLLQIGGYGLVLGAGAALMGFSHQIWKDAPNRKADPEEAERIRALYKLPVKEALPALIRVEIKRLRRFTWWSTLVEILEFPLLAIIWFTLWYTGVRFGWFLLWAIYNLGKMLVSEVHSFVQSLPLG